MFIIVIHQDHWKQIKSAIQIKLSRRSFPYQSRISIRLSKLKGVALLSTRKLQPSPVLRNRCWSCQSKKIDIHHQTGYLICQSCGYVLDEHAVESSSYQNLSAGPAMARNSKQMVPRRLSTNNMKRLNHFKKWLQRLQGKEDIVISLQELNAIKLELNRCPYTPITQQKIRGALKRLRLFKYYNHIFYLLRQFTGNALIEFDEHHEKTLYQFFYMIQETFCQVATNRANMISYLYLIRKMSELMGWTEIANSIPFLKSRIRNRELDKLWKRICDVHHINFIPSV